MYQTARQLCFVADQLLGIKNNYSSRDIIVAGSFPLLMEVQGNILGLSVAKLLSRKSVS